MHEGVNFTDRLQHIKNQNWSSSWTCEYLCFKEKQAIYNIAAHRGLEKNRFPFVIKQRCEHTELCKSPPTLLACCQVYHQPQEQSSLWRYLCKTTSLWLQSIGKEDKGLTLAGVADSDKKEEREKAIFIHCEIIQGLLWAGHCSDQDPFVSYYQ